MKTPNLSKRPCLLEVEQKLKAQVIGIKSVSQWVNFTLKYARIVNAWVEEIGLDSANYGTHTMRRTKVSQIYKGTKNLRAIQLLLGHTKLDSTVRYLGIEVDDALELAEQTEVQ